ncbi:MAG: NAD(P)H-binding protein [Phycisphaerales bacterium]
MSAETVAVTGATGFVGRHMVSALLDAGHRVNALTRDAGKASDVLHAEAIRDGRIRVVEGGILDEGVADRLVDGADACFHLIGIIREAGGRQTFERMHTRATERIAGACHDRQERTGDRVRYVHMSALGVGGESAIRYRATKFTGEQAVRDSGLDWTIFRPGLIHGPDGEFMQMVKSWAEGRSLPYAFMPAFVRPRRDAKMLGPVPLPIPSEWETATVAPVHVDDVCGAFVKALGTPESVGEIYHLVGAEELTMEEMMELVRDNVPLGKRGMRVIGVPGVVAAMKAKAAEFVGMGRLLPFDSGMALMAIEDSTAPLDKAREHLGFEPVAFTPSFESYAASM